MYRFNTIILLFFLLCSSLVYGQFDKLQNYNVKDGLASSEIYRIMQDRKGYIWSCGDMGVSRFNGYEFKNFTSENGLPDNTVFGVYEDEKNRTWFYPYSSKLSFLKNDTVKALSCGDTLEKLLKHQFITVMYVDSRDTIWLGTTNNFIIKIAPGWRTKDVKKIKIPDGKYFFYVENKGLIYGGNNPESCTITSYTKDLKKIFSIEPGIYDEKINIQKKKGYLRFYLLRLTDRSYLASINEHLIKFTEKGISYKTKERSVIINLLEDVDHSYIVGTYSGVAFFSDKLERKRTINQLENKIITSSCLDKENGLWLSTEGQGLFYIAHRNFSYYTSQNGLPESKITCIGLYDSNVVIGHLDGSASVLYKDTVRKIYNNIKVNTFAQAGRLTSILSYNGKTMVTSMRSVYYLKNNRLTIIPEFENLAYKKFIKSNNGNILGLNYREVATYDKQSYKILDSVILQSRTDNIFEDSENNIWLSCSNGVYVSKENKLDYLGINNKLFSLRASDINEAFNKTIWIATRGGGVLVKKGSSLKQFTEKDGLAGNMCRSLYIDSNIVWVGTNKGLSRITINGDNNYSIDNFYAINGLLTNEVNTIIKHNNKLWLAHNSGISVFDERNIKPNKHPPPIYILQTFVNDSLCNTKDLAKLEHEKNRLTINYLGISYKAAGHVEYKYKMLGIDSNWVFTNYTTVNYHTIPPGTYRFIVSAKNNDGYWSTLPATITIYILQPWWKNWIFISFVIIVIVLLIGFLFKHRLSIIKQKERLKAIQQTKLSNAELKALRAQMNPHFVFNAINSVQYFITNNDPVSSQKYLSKFAKLIRYVVDNSKPLAIPLSKELEALNLYLDLEWLRFENKFEYTIEIDKNVDVEGVQIPSMLIQPYVENAIWHGLMHKNSKGKIKIEISRYENVLFCVIEDNGIGRKRSQEIIKEKNSEFHKSVGLSITHERLEVINQQRNSKLTVSVIDLEDNEGNGIGTRVELNLPLY